ncbi:MsnO8 family LLM class oxidoreductase [Antrihabitans cavernicola]|uniref:MsnO8 family LLM class oxidoreductase n=1 Tax=Antrihabitans cavernicola TaxID=2495913 RepID=UPI001659BC20|nr:MsnO8 family LLM class oxidoreductase [Spelaeibacter cavernicola]
MLLSILDRSRTRAGTPDSAALTATIERAVHAEQLGYHRFWVAEHHGVPGIASGSPPVLIAAIGAHTSRIRVGSGGVMVPNHQPLVVAEQFLMLEALYPGRIDLGLGRSLGFTEPVREALRRSKDEPDTFADDIAELHSYLDGAGAVTARPRVRPRPPTFVLATGAGLDVAAAAGLPVVVGGPILHRADTVELDHYRRTFRPTVANPVPYVVISLDILIADSRIEARRLALPEAWAMARSRRDGEFPQLESTDDIDESTWTPRVRERIERSLASSIHGTATDVRTELDRIVERTGADEVLASTSTYDRTALFDADRALLASYHQPVAAPI